MSRKLVYWVVGGSVAATAVVVPTSVVLSLPKNSNESEAKIQNLETEWNNLGDANHVLSIEGLDITSVNEINSWETLKNKILATNKNQNIALKQFIINAESIGATFENSTFISLPNGLEINLKIKVGDKSIITKQLIFKGSEEQNKPDTNGDQNNKPDGNEEQNKPDINGEQNNKPGGNEEQNKPDINGDQNNKPGGDTQDNNNSGNEENTTKPPVASGILTNEIAREWKTYKQTSQNTTLTAADLNGYTTIANSAFASNQYFTSIEIPNSVTSIGASAFESSKNLSSVVIPDSVTSIGNQAFTNCTNLVSITANTRFWIKWSDYGFSIKQKQNVNWTGEQPSKPNLPANKILTSQIVQNMIKYKAFKVDTTISAADLNGYTTIAEKAFSENKYFTSIEIPDSVTNIGNWAFDGSNLTKVTLPGTITKMGQSIFNNCTKLKEAILNDGISNISKFAFANSGLSKISIPNSVKTIGSGAFSDCKDLKNIILPNNLENISDNTFSSSGLKEIEIPASVSKIGVSAFSGCYNLVKVTINNGVKSIGAQAFNNCQSLGSPKNYTLEIPDSVTDLGNASFKGTAGLHSVKLSSIFNWDNKNYPKKQEQLRLSGLLWEEVNDKIVKRNISFSWWT